ncbi:hypothetical protein C8R47DRAFT_644406 [Mycena vitilis]|nr:hypothetical protein C8R47DRAFT_644406 [Mycena vitilis]
MSVRHRRKTLRQCTEDMLATPLLLQAGSAAWGTGAMRFRHPDRDVDASILVGRRCDCLLWTLHRIVGSPSRQPTQSKYQRVASLHDVATRMPDVSTLSLSGASPTHIGSGPSLPGWEAYGQTAALKKALYTVWCSRPTYPLALAVAPRRTECWDVSGS